MSQAAQFSRYYIKVHHLEGEERKNLKYFRRKKDIFLPWKLQCSVQWSITTDNSDIRWKDRNEDNGRNQLFCKFFFLDYYVFNSTWLLKSLLKVLRACPAIQNSWGAVGKQVFPLSVCSTRWENTKQMECGKETILMMAIINDDCDSVRHSNTTTNGKKWFKTAEVWEEHLGLLLGFFSKVS